MQAPQSIILHITPQTDWLAAVEQGVYQTQSLTKEGFIHCSKPSQVVDVANTWYQGMRGLVLLVIEPEKLREELRWEPPAHPHPGQASSLEEDLFPHIYGPLNLDAVKKVIQFEPDANGTFSLPFGLES